ncbi:MAG TPA: hypothetical protein VK524_15875 [Polyangiaceae bacterium]|nr:hypothetical protein [Polyangiaceae bacterium]
MRFKQSKFGITGVVLCGAVLGCSDEDPEVGGAPNAAELACDALELAEPEHGTQVKIVLPLGAGEEREVCQLVRLDEDMNFNWSDGVYTKGSHHALVLRTAYHGTLPATALDGRAIDGAALHDCTTPSALWDTRGSLAVARSPDTPEANVSPRGSLPDHVGVRMEKDDYILVNFHMLNATREPMTACTKINMNGIDDAQVTEEAGGIVWYNPFITVPALGQATARMACEIPTDILLRNVVLHAHSRLDGYTARLWDGSPTRGGRVQDTLYENSEWEDPVPRTFAPEPLKLAKGQWIDFECHYLNSSPRNAAQGFETTDEMCMFTGLYWPRNEALENCGRELKSSQQLTFFGSGAKKGSEVLACFLGLPPEEQIFQGGGAETSELRFTAMSCFTQACPQVADEVTAFVRTCEKSNPTAPECTAAVAALNTAECD